MSENAIALPGVAIDIFVKPLPLPDSEDAVTIPVTLIPPAPVIIPEDGIEAPYDTIIAVSEDDLSESTLISDGMILSN
jgi:hypothetical protein